MTGATVALAAALVSVVAVAVAIVVLVRSQQRHRRQMQALLERLAALDDARGVDVSQVTLPGDRAGPGGHEQAAGASESSPSGDVLAGRTSHVRRMVEGSGVEAASLADQAIVWVHRHLEENVAPAQIAAELFVSLRTLERGLATGLDCTPTELIVAVKMREARKLLRSGRFRVSEVAYRLAFSSPSHFSRRYKSFYGAAPSEHIPDA